MATKTPKSIRTIKDITPDPMNANRGTEKGLGMLENSLRNYGAGRSILVDRNGVVIAGNKTLEQAAAIGLDSIVTVPTDGKKLVVVQRTDLDLKTKKAKEMAVADNRTAEVGLNWDSDVLAKLDVDLSQLWDERELSKILGKVRIDGESDGGTGTKAALCMCEKCGDQHYKHSDEPAKGK